MTKETKNLITPKMLENIGYTNTANVHGDPKFIPNEYELKDKLEEWFSVQAFEFNINYRIVENGCGGLWRATLVKFTPFENGNTVRLTYDKTESAKLEALLKLYHAIKATK